MTEDQCVGSPDLAAEVLVLQHEISKWHRTSAYIGDAMSTIHNDLKKGMRVQTEAFQDLCDLPGLHIPAIQRAYIKDAWGYSPPFQDKASFDEFPNFGNQLALSMLFLMGKN